mgnify:CR=1 FL=1
MSAVRPTRGVAPADGGFGALALAALLQLLTQQIGEHVATAALAAIDQEFRANIRFETDCVHDWAFKR